MTGKRKRSWVRVVVGVLAAVCFAVGVWFWMRPSYAELASARLAGELRHVDVKPGFNLESVTITHPDDMTAIRDAVVQADSPKFGYSYVVPQQPLIFHFADGRKVEMVISSAAVVFDKDDTPVPTSVYMVVEWDDHFRVIDRRPVIEALRRVGVYGNVDAAAD